MGGVCTVCTYPYTNLEPLTRLRRLSHVLASSMPLEIYIETLSRTAEGPGPRDK